MRLLHYSSNMIEKLLQIEYPQKDMNWHAKPNGLWLSVEGDDDWKWWCEQEEFLLENLEFVYEVILKKEANVLHLLWEDQIIDMAKKYPYGDFLWPTKEPRTYELDWELVKKDYQGIIISPYQWGCRMDQDCCWYYGWDCASGCIWDLDCIDEFKRVDK
jgi:hypothetical protein